MWTRINLYTSLLGAGLVIQAEGNARRTDDLEKPAYVVQMQNLVAPVREAESQTTAPSTLKKRFKLTFGPNSGQASLNFATDFTNLLPRPSTQSLAVPGAGRDDHLRRPAIRVRWRAERVRAQEPKRGRSRSSARK